MINVTELRIGNIAWESNSFTPSPDDFDEIRVAQIDDINKVIRDDQENGYSYNMLYGIPLTSDWLQRMGMIWKSVPDSDGSEHNIYTATWGDFDLVMFDNWVLEVESIRMPHIKHVHQLQNLYWCLVGEELKLKDK